MTRGKPTYRAPALEKGLVILELLANSPDAMSINAISDAIGHSRNEIFRMLLVLEEFGYISRGEGDSGYKLTNRLFRLAMEQPSIKNVVESALPVMHRLADATQLPCHLVVPSYEQIVVVARVEPPGDIGLVVRIGHRRPIGQSATGHVLFAYQSEEVRERWLSIITEHEPGFDRKNLIRIANKIRSQGYASEPSRIVKDVTDLSAPVLQDGHAVCAVSVPFLAHPFSKTTREHAIELLCSAAADISKSL